jgi:hypothetical protein
MSRWRGRNDILPRMAIAQHPQLTTDKSAFSPLDKIALQSTPDGRAIWMECCVHDLPTKITRAVLPRANTSAARHSHSLSYVRSKQRLRSYNGGKIGSARAQHLRQLGDVGGDAPGLAGRGSGFTRHSSAARTRVR